MGPLYQRFGESVVVSRGNAPRAKVSSIIDHGSWKWPRQRNRRIMDIIRHTPDGFLPNPSLPDKILWTLTLDGQFTTKSAWEACRYRNPFQQWHSLVWFGQGAPRWSFIEWLVVLGRLSTKDRLISWGMAVSPQCTLCMTVLESHSHLFFDCPFSSLIWRQLLVRNGISRPILPFSQELEWAVYNMNGKSFRDVLFKLSMAASIYTLWEERNMRIFQGKARDVDGVSLAIFNSIRAKVSSWSAIKFSAMNRRLCEDWLLDSRIFAVNNCP